MQERNFINLQLNELKEILLNYYKQKLENDDLGIELKLNTFFNRTEVSFIISTIKKLNQRCI